jgi:branched-chain amino acid transport system permease protein
VTLGFAEMLRLFLVSANFTNGPRGIAYIPPPHFFGLDLNESLRPFLSAAGLVHPYTNLNSVFIYFVSLMLVLLAIFLVRRLEDSRLGRSWLALREDEEAARAMGVSRSRARLTAFAMGSAFAGAAGVVFASQITFVNPASFTFTQSVLILAIVVLGGMGSIPGMVCGTIILVLLPEYLRAFSFPRMLFFGMLIVLMMVFRPGGIVRRQRRPPAYLRQEYFMGGERPDSVADTR